MGGLPLATEIRQQQLPDTLILLPFIESGYQLNVVSPAGAAGLWQLMPQTAHRFAVPIRQDYDGRYSVDDSTRAALRYLKWLHKKFEGDWLLAIAAYNAGEGRIQTAISQNKKNYWQLSLPEETQRYIPRLIALAELIYFSTHYQLTTPHWHSGADFIISRQSKNLNISSNQDNLSTRLDENNSILIKGLDINRQAPFIFFNKDSVPTIINLDDGTHRKNKVTWLETQPILDLKTFERLINID